MYGENLYGDTARNPYGLPFDTNYLESEASDVDVMLDQPITARGDKEPSGATIREVGTTTNPFEHQTKALLARIREGASRVEFEFMGTGKSSKQQFSPETFGKIERQEMRDLAKLNEVETSTHATPNAGPMSGLSQQGGSMSFSEEQRRNVMKELQKAVDFAAEATTGGAIVLHIGEWNRPIDQFYGKDSQSKDKDKYGSFKKYESDRLVDTERGNKPLTNEDVKKLNISSDQIGDGKRYRYQREWDDTEFHLVDEITGGVQALNRNMTFDVPKVDRESTIKANGGETDENKWDKKIFKLKDGKIETQQKSFDQLVQEYRAQHPDEKKSDEEIVLKNYLDEKRSLAEGESQRFTEGLEGYKQAFNKLDERAQKAKQSYQQAIKEFKAQKGREPTEGDLEQIQNNLNSTLGRDELNRPIANLIEDSYKDQMKDELWGHINSYQQLASSYKQQVDQLNRQQKRLKPIKEFGLQKTADTIAKAAIYADEQYNNHKKDLKNELYISPESFMPEQYGGHPDEIKEVIEASRKKMVELLSNKYDKKEAQKLAEKRIKATLDAGHLNQWRKYFERKKGESMDQYEQRFNKWLLDKTEDLAKGGYVGHAHLSDNFGYDDDHLVPGEGNVPYKDFIRRMRQHGVNEFIQEPGSFNYEYALRQTWRNMGVTNLGASYRSTGRGLSERTDKFMNSYFGHTAKPSYVFGKYIPQGDSTQKSWAPWSGTPL